MEEKKKAQAAFSRLYDIVEELREKCPWDRKQTFESLRSNTIEEVYELADAIIDENMEEVVYEIQAQTHLNTRGVEIGYLQRGGEPTYYDRMLGVRWGVLAVQLLMQDMTNLALGIKNDKIFSTPLVEVEHVLQEFRVDMVNDLRTLHALPKL